MSLNKTLGTLAALLVAGALALWCVTHLELREVKQVVPPSPRVQDDPFYALQQILTPAVTVSRYSDPAKIDLGHASLVILNARNLQTMDKGRLTRWLDDGGDLLVYFVDPSVQPAASWWEGKGPFADLAPLFQKPKKTADSPSDTAVPTEESGAAGAPPTARKAEGGVLVDPRVSFPHAIRDKRTSIIQVGQANNAVARVWGRGALIVSGAPLFLENSNLKDSDNLAFTEWFLGDLVSHPGGVAWIPQSYASQAAGGGFETWPILVAFLSVFFLLFWMRSPRLGPTIPETPAETRSLRVRFRSEGRFLWRYGAGELLMRSLESGRSLDEVASSDPQRAQKWVVGLRNRLRRPSRNDFQIAIAEQVEVSARARELR